MIVADTFNTEFACNALESLARQQSCPSPELGALELAAYALLFLTTPQPPAGMVDIRLEDVPIATVVKDWSSYGHSFEALLAPWKLEVAEWATNEQQHFLRQLNNTDDDATTHEENDLDARPIADILPQPVEALKVLENLAKRYSRDTLNHLRAAIAVQALRYVVDNRLVVKLGTFLDQAGKSHVAFEEG